MKATAVSQIDDSCVAAVGPKATEQYISVQPEVDEREFRVGRKRKIQRW
jgi:hypothetical protein